MPIGFNTGVILVTGATGRLGRLVVAALLEGGQPVRALVRAASVIPEGWGAVRLVRGDLDDPGSLPDAITGVETVVVVSPMTPWLDRQDGAVLEAAEEGQVRHVVKVSTTAPDAASPISWWRAHWRAEERLRGSPLGWTILRPNGIAMFLLDFAAEVAATGAFTTGAGSGRMALVHPGDVGLATATVATAPTRFAGRVLDLTGPEPLSYDDVAAQLGSLLGRPVEHRAVDPAAAAEHLRRAGLRGWEAEGVLANWLMTRDRVGGFARVSGDLAEVLGRPPRSVHDYLAEHLDRFRGAA